MGQGHDQVCFVLKNARELVKKVFKDILFSREHLKFPENLRYFGAKTFFYFLFLFGDHLGVVSLALA